MPRTTNGVAELVYEFEFCFMESCCSRTIRMKQEYRPSGLMKRELDLILHLICMTFCEPLDPADTRSDRATSSPLTVRLSGLVEMYAPYRYRSWTTWPYKRETLVDDRGSLP